MQIQTHHTVEHQEPAVSVVLGVPSPTCPCLRPLLSTLKTASNSFLYAFFILKYSLSHLGSFPKEYIKSAIFTLVK